MFLKYVYSKYLYEADELMMSDLMLYTYSLDSLILMGKKDYKYLEVWEDFLTNARRLLPELQRPCTNQPFKTKNILHISYTAEKFGTPLTFSPRAYFGMQNNKIFQSKLKGALVAKENLQYYTPASFIGVGYRDKGTRRNPEKDGSQSWQEVASSTLPKTSKDYKEGRNELFSQAITQRIVQGYIQTPQEQEKMKLKILELEIEVRSEDNPSDPAWKIMFHDPNQEWLAKYCKERPEGTVEVTHTLKS